jgi:ABC-2 type transport system ATP-binding protein
MHEAAALATRVALLKDGRIIATGAPAALISALGQAVRIDLRLATPVRLDRLTALPEVTGGSVETDGEGMPFLRLLGRPGPDGGASTLLGRIVTEVVAEGGQIRSIDVSAPNLGDLLLQSTEEET